jgi:hypothetical protein
VRRERDAAIKTFWLLQYRILHILQEYLLAASVIEFRGPAVGVTGDPQSGFKGAIISRKFVMPVARNECGE